MKWVLLALVPVAFVAGIIVGRKTVSPPEPVAKLAPPPPSLPVVEPAVAPPPAMVQAEEESTDADAYAQQGLEAYVKGQYALSIELCNKAIRINAHQPLALRILGAVNCKLRNRDGALKAYNQAQPQFRNFIRMVCHSEGVELP